MKSSFFAIVFFLSLSALPKPIRLALNWKAEPQFGGFYEAERRTLFKNVGVPVEIQQGGSGTPTLQMLLSGQIEYGIVSADEIIIAAARGNANIVALFAVYQKNPQGIMVRDSNPAKDLPTFFQGSGTLLWQEGLPYAQFLKKKYGPFKIKTAPYTGGIANFVADSTVSQQCFMTSEPLTARKQNLKVKTFLVAESGYNPYTTVLAVKKDRLKEHPDEVKKMVQAVREAWGSYLLEPRATHELIHQLNPSMDIGTLEASGNAQKPLIEVPHGAKLGSMTMERWETLVLQLKDLGVIQQAVEAKSLFENVQ